MTSSRPSSSDDARAAFPLGGFDFGDCRRFAPVAPDYGFARGRPVDRHYIERFLERQAACIQGRVLEVEDRRYTERFGGTRVTRSDVLHVTPGHPGATIIADLEDAPQLPSAQYDCVVLTQTLQYVYDLRAALRTLRRIIAPGGVLLATLPGLSRTSDPQWSERWYWNFTSRSASRLVGEAFGAANTAVQGFGNLLVATAFLHGLAEQDLAAEDFVPCDEGFEIVIGVHARVPLA